MNVQDLTLLSMYAVSAADGKIGKASSRVTPELTGLTIKEIEEKLESFDNIVVEISKLPKEAIESILASARFIMMADNVIDPNEEVIVNKIADLLK